MTFHWMKLTADTAYSKHCVTAEAEDKIDHESLEFHHADQTQGGQSRGEHDWVHGLTGPSGLITSVGEERANLSAVVYL